ncbi:hypothetical protein KC330_g8068 [Hortaea werneckii]|nr:hypothetical protein KC330_g8068 [Hortaea werneckii]
MSEAGPSNQIAKNAPIGPNQEWIVEYANTMNLTIDQARIKLAEFAKIEESEQQKPPPPPPPVPAPAPAPAPAAAPAQSVDKLDAVIARMQQMNHKIDSMETENKTLRHRIDSVEVENKNLRNELNKVRNQSQNNRGPPRNDANTTQLNNKYNALEKQSNDKFANQDKWNATCRPIVEKSKQRLDNSEQRLQKIEESLYGETGMPRIEDDVGLLYEYCNVTVNRLYPGCKDLDEVREYWQSSKRLPPSLTRPSNPSPFHMGAMAGALPAPQSNNMPMGQNMMPQQQHQQQMVPQQHSMMQQFSNPPMMQQQLPQQQQQPSQLPYGMNMLPYMGQGGMPPRFQ